MKVIAAKLQKFQEEISGFYRYQGRHDLPWRKKITPYRILVSEIMLQQTQVDRVVPKFELFLKTFPTIKSLAAADTSKLLSVWSGLGYNRRALWLRDAARALAQKGGRVPRDPEILETLKGIGHYTARAIPVFAYNEPQVFIETNVRRAFIHHFFPKKKSVHDRDLFPLIEKTIPRDVSSREWYWALMDYGSHLAKMVPNPNRRSKHYTKQSKFEGSLRQLRGKILRALSEEGKTFIMLVQETGDSKERIEIALEQLQKEGFIEKIQNIFGIKK